MKSGIVLTTIGVLGLGGLFALNEYLPSQMTSFYWSIHIDPNSSDAASNAFDVFMVCATVSFGIFGLAKLAKCIAKSIAERVKCIKELVCDCQTCQLSYES